MYSVEILIRADAGAVLFAIVNLLADTDEVQKMLVHGSVFGSENMIPSQEMSAYVPRG